MITKSKNKSINFSDVTIYVHRGERKLMKCTPDGSLDIGNRFVMPITYPILSSILKHHKFGLREWNEDIAYFICENFDIKLKENE